MADTPTPSTAECLRLAADHLERIGWTDSITWYGVNTLGLHAHDLSAWYRLMGQHDALGLASEHRTHHNPDGSYFSTMTYRLASGLRLDVFGPRSTPDDDPARWAA